MSRRPGAFRDPTARGASADELLLQMLSVLNTLSERERRIIMLRFGFPDGEPSSLDEIARTHGETRERVRLIEAKVMAKLRHRSRSQVLECFADGDLGRLPHHIRANILGFDIELHPLSFCDRHGWFDSRPDVAGRQTCEQCPCSIKAADEGRPRRYCSAACRQAAYRRRR